MLHLNTLDYSRWGETTKQEDWIDTYNEGFKKLKKLQPAGVKDYSQFQFDLVMANPPFAGDIKENTIISHYELVLKQVVDQNIWRLKQLKLLPSASQAAAEEDYNREPPPDIDWPTDEEAKFTWFYYEMLKLNKDGARVLLKGKIDFAEHHYETECTVLDVTKDSILENTKSFAVIEKLAQENNVILDEAALSELETERAETVESLGGEESYRAELAKLGLSEETYDRMCRSDYLYSALEELAATEGSSLYATDEQLIAYAAKQGYMTADHILLLTRDMSTYQELDDETKAEKKALAEELKAKLDAYTGDDLIGYFTELADEYSEDSGRAGNPEGYTFGSGQMVEEFESAAAALGEGEVSEIVESYYGYHIILRKPLDEAKAVDAVRETYFSGLLESRIEDAAVEMNPAVEALDLVDIYDAFSLLMDTDADGDTADDTATENGQESAES